MSPHDAQVRLDAQRDRAGELAEVRRDAVRHHRKHRHAERLGGVGRDAFREDAIDREPQVAVLFRAAERQHGAVVVPQVLFHLHPVHVGNAHVDLQSVVDSSELYVDAMAGPSRRLFFGDCSVFANSGLELSAELREPVQHDRDVVCAEAIASRAKPRLGASRGQRDARTAPMPAISSCARIAS